MNYLSKTFENGAYDIKERISTEKYVGFLNNLSKSAIINPISAAMMECSMCHSEMTMLFTAVDYSVRTGRNISVAQAANLMKVSMPAASRTLKALAHNDYVERTSDEEDRRSVQIVVTEKGRNMLDNCVNSFFSVINKALSDFSNSDIEKMMQLYGKFVNAVTGISNTK